MMQEDLPLARLATSQERPHVRFKKIDEFKDHLNKAVDINFYLQDPKSLKKLLPQGNFKKMPTLKTHKDRTPGEKIFFSKEMKKIPIHNAIMAPYSSFLHFVFETNPGFKALLKSRLKDQIVLDLGAGTGSTRDGSINIPTIDVMRECGVRDLILVEPYFAKELANNVCTLEKNPHTISPLNTWVIPENMYDFLRRLPDKSCSILTAGIDEWIILYPEERMAIASEIQRVLHPQGVYLSVHSDIPSLDLNYMGEFEGTIPVEGVNVYTRP